MTTADSKKGTIFDIQRFTINDGYGLRTLIFMKGCPLRCLWCSNPESQSAQKEIMHIGQKCIGCGWCIKACPQEAISAGTFAIDRERCAACGACAELCPANAKKEVGREYSVQEAIQEIEKDSVFYRRSQGGVTIGGGEPAAQPLFVTNLLKECKRLNMHTAVESCGYGEWEKIKGVYEMADQIFLDIKHMNDERHRELTGVSNKPILDNAKRIATLNKDTTFRIPLIPGVNDSEENIRKTGEYVRSLMNPHNNIKIEILLYHNLGANKYDAIGKKYALMNIETPEEDIKRHYEDILSLLGCNVVK